MEQQRNFICEKVITNNDHICIIVRGPYDSLMTYNFTTDKIIFSTLPQGNKWLTAMIEIAHAFAQEG